MQKSRAKLKEIVKTAKGRRISSTKWLERHINDPYVQMARDKGYRSRAAFKLLQIEEKFKILKSSKSIVDLGCAPGGWLQVIRNLAPKNAKVIGIDLQEVVPIAGVDLIVGDIYEDKTMEDYKAIQPEKIDLLLSDMAASSCGTPDVDHLRSIALIEIVMYFAMDHLKAKGNMIAKVIRGGQEQMTTERLRKLFKEVKQFKPDASYSGSAEFYYVCKGFKEGVDPFRCYATSS